MALPREPSGIGIWPLVLGVAAVILVAVLFFMFAPIQKPVPTPDSPAALGIDGAPAGATGDGLRPGAPQGTAVPPAVVPAEPAPAAPVPPAPVPAAPTPAEPAGTAG